MTLIKQWIDSAAALWDEAPYLEDAGGGDTLTFAGLQRASRAWARTLDRAGIPPGARVALRLPDPVEYACALVALIGAGRVVVPLDPGAPVASLATALKTAQPEAIVAHGLHRDLPVLPPPAPGGENLPAGSSPVPAAGGIFLSTSGTSGTPKGVLLHDAQLSHVAMCVAIHHRLTPADRGYCCLPLFHVNAEVVGLLATLAARASLVLDRKFSRRGFWPMIEKQEITWINAVPAIISILAMDPRAAGATAPGSLGVRFVRSASAPLPPAALHRFECAFGIPVVETYGMTEAASMITANPLTGPRKPGSAGRPASAEVRIMPSQPREHPTPCPPLTVGRVQIKGPGVITEYATGAPPGAITPDGWLDTGDLGHLDRDGYLFLAGRADDVINRGGEKIYPREIEDFLLAQPGVRSAAVIGLHDDVLGERPVAYIVPTDPRLLDPRLLDPSEPAPPQAPTPHPASLRLADPSQSDPHPSDGQLAESVRAASQLTDALRAACDAALPRPKRPTAYHLAAELPLSATGKISRSRLRELARTHRLTKPGAAA